MNPTREGRVNSVMAVGLIAVGVLSRLAPHPMNVTPLAAIALFGGTYLSKRWSIWLPLVIVAISDVLIGWHRTVAFTWGAFALTGLIGWWLRRRPSAWRIAGGAVMSSALFFVITNFGVWATEELYPRTAAGLWQCYVAGIPFLRNTLAGDLVYTAVLFGLYALATNVRPARLSTH